MNKSITPSPEQQRFIDDNSDFLIVTAGPGSGKTTTLVRYLLKHAHSLQPFRKIVACSFTRISSNEIKLKTKNSTNSPEELEGIVFSTFDSFLITEVWKFYFKRIIIFAKENYNIATLVDVKNFKKVEFSNLKWDDYEHLKSTHNKVSFREKVSLFITKASEGILHYGFIAEDILLNFIKYDSSIKKYLSNTFDRFIIDEAQDLNILRYSFLKFFYEKLGIKITLVGDERQTLYEFLGAKKDIFERLLNKIPEAKSIILEKNWRIVNTGDERKYRDQVQLFTLKNPEDFKASLKKYGNFQISKNLKEPLSDISNNESILILTKDNAEISEVSKHLKKLSIPHTYTGYLRGYERDVVEISELMHLYFLMKSNQLKTSININISNSISDFLWPNDARSNEKFLKFFFSDQSDIEQKIEKIEKMKGIHLQGAWQELMDDKYKNSLLPISKIHIMTIFASKGLEADSILINLESIKSFIKGDSWKATTFNQMFVALSRAKKNVIFYSMPKET